MKTFRYLRKFILMSSFIRRLDFEVSSRAATFLISSLAECRAELTIPGIGLGFVPKTMKWISSCQFAGNTSVHNCSDPLNPDLLWWDRLLRLVCDCPQQREASKRYGASQQKRGSP